MDPNQHPPHAPGAHLGAPSYPQNFVPPTAPAAAPFPQNPDDSGPPPAAGVPTVTPRPWPSPQLGEQAVPPPPAAVEAQEQPAQTLPQLPNAPPLAAPHPVAAAAVPTAHLQAAPPHAPSLVHPGHATPPYPSPGAAPYLPTPPLPPQMPVQPQFLPPHAGQADEAMRPLTPEEVAAGFVLRHLVGPSAETAPEAAPATDPRHAACAAAIPPDHEFFATAKAAPSGYPLSELFLRPGEPKRLMLVPVAPAAVTLHEFWEDKRPYRFACIGDGCPLCECCVPSKRTFLVAVFDPNDGRIKYLAVEQASLPYSLQTALSPFLMRPDMETLQLDVRREDRNHYTVVDTGRKVSPPAYKAARASFQAGGGGDCLQRLFPQETWNTLVQVPVIHSLRLRFGYVSQEVADPWTGT